MRRTVLRKCHSVVNRCGRETILLLSCAFLAIATDVRSHMDNFAILHPIMFRDAIELASGTIFCHNYKNLSFTGCINVAVNINGNAKVALS